MGDPGEHQPFLLESCWGLHTSGPYQVKVTETSYLVLWDSPPDSIRPATLGASGLTSLVPEKKAKTMANLEHASLDLGIHPVESVLSTE